MKKRNSNQPGFFPSGYIEPHAALLNVPSNEQLLYKMMSIENLLSSIGGSYLHFNRVDSYADFPCADSNDGQQLPVDRPGNAGAKFLKAPAFGAADYYDQSRARTYACCFSMDNSDYIWSNYANGSMRGKVCVVFNFGGLRARLNASLDPATSKLLYNGVLCKHIFSVNYGIVEYIDWDSYQANAKHLPNPIMYTYMKAMRFSPEKELRVSLSAFGLGFFVLNDGTTIDFPMSMQVPFDFQAALADGTIQKVLCALDCDKDFLYAELAKLNIMPAPEGDPPG